MQAALAEVLLPLIPTLGVEKAVEVFDPGVVDFARLFNQQQVDPGEIPRLLADMVDDDAFVSAEDVDGQVVLSLDPWDLRDRRGEIDPVEV